MKTFNLRSVQYSSTFFLFLFFFGVIPATSVSISDIVYNEPDDTVYVEYRGQVFDSFSKVPVIFASIIVSGTNIGTVTNTDGEFIIKIPSALTNRNLQIIILGYKSKSFPISTLNPSGNELFLEPVSYPLEEVEIRKIDPVNLLRDALKNVPENYGPDSRMLTAFYRETIKQNRNYVAISEAVFDVYKSGYGKLFDSDRIRIYKGRKSQDVTRMDTILFKLQGGPYNMFQLDLAKHPGDILSGEIFDYYKYDIRGTVEINGRNSYMISFEQKKGVPLPLYKGNIFIDIETKAIVSAEFSLSELGIEKAAEFMIVRKPPRLNAEVVSADYRVNYRLDDKRWAINYARAEVHFRVRWQRRLFRSNYYTVSEMAVTDINDDQVVKFKFRETTRPDDIFTDKVSYFEDTEFWGDYNIIQPEQTIEEAIEKLGRRLQRIED